MQQTNRMISEEQVARSFVTDEEMYEYVERHGTTLVKMDLDVLWDEETRKHQVFLFLDESRGVIVENECEADLVIVDEPPRHYGSSTSFQYEPMQGFVKVRKLVFSKFPGKVCEIGFQLKRGF